LYRAPSGGISKESDLILKDPYSPESKFVICGDINVNYLNEITDQHLLNTYNLSHAVNFVTRAQHSLGTAIAAFFIDTSKVSSLCISPIANGLSDPNAQLLTLKGVTLEVNQEPSKYRLRKVNCGRFPWRALPSVWY
jgi:hypothetical protein